MKTIQEFCNTHHACREGRNWASINCRSMQEAWDTAPNPSWVVWIATRKGVLSHRELVQFSLYCARSVQHLMKDVRSIQALDTVERWLAGDVGNEELQQAKDSAYAAYVAYAAYAAYVAYTAAAAYAAYAAAFAATAAAATAAAADVAATAAAAVAADAADVAAVAADAKQKQAAWLRENTKPNFE